MSTNTYLKLDKIKGESTDDKHKDQIEVFSFSHGLAQPISGPSGTGGRAAARADFQSLQITKYVDAASPDLDIYCAQGSHIATAELEVCQETGSKECYWRYDFKNLMVESVSVSGGGSDRPVESVTFVYDEVKWTYTPIDTEGNAGTAVDRAWSLAENKKL